MKQKIKVSAAKLFNHLHKVKKRHVERFIHTRIHTHHALVHMGELLVVGMVGFSSLLFANYNNSYEHLHRNTTQEIISSLTKAIEQQKPTTTDSKIISVWEMDGNVNNTFAPGYCTYGAARISPEFFPYSEDKMSQDRTRGGNAVDRCENAAATGFKIGSTPSQGALIVYSKIGTNGILGHVGKVMYYNQKYKSLIVREMNWLGKFIMTDRREAMDNDNIKCYIYPKKDTNTVNDTNTDKEPVLSGSTPSTNTTTNSESESIPTTNGNIASHEAAPTTNTTTQQTNQNQTTNNSITPKNSQTTTISNENQEQENTSFYNQTSIQQQELVIEPTDEFSDISKHFFSLYEMKITVAKDPIIHIGNSIIIKIIITDKQTKESYQGILPFIFNSISQNNLLESSLETIQFVHSDENNIIFKAKEKGSSTIILTIDDQKIATIPVTIQ